jgi:hypothetical protein
MVSDPRGGSVALSDRQDRRRQVFLKRSTTDSRATPANGDKRRAACAGGADSGTPTARPGGQGRKICCVDQLERLNATAPFKRSGRSQTADLFLNRAIYVDTEGDRSRQRHSCSSSITRAINVGIGHRRSRHTCVGRMRSERWYTSSSSVTMEQGTNYAPTGIGREACWILGLRRHWRDKRVAPVRSHMPSILPPTRSVTRCVVDTRLCAKRCCYW